MSGYLNKQAYGSSIVVVVVVEFLRVQMIGAVW